MKWRVGIRSAAENDIQQARDWYDNQRKGLGDEFLLAIADAFARLEDTPERFPVYYRGFRRILTERFPYKAFLQN